MQTADAPTIQNLTPDVSSPIHSNPSCSPPDLPHLQEKDYTPIPDDQTVIDHPPYNLTSLGVVINLYFRVLLCVNCERAIDSSKLVSHVHRHNPLVEVPSDLPKILVEAYKLVPYASVQHRCGPIPPIFGLSLHHEPLNFCDCGKAYATYDTLRQHQTRRDRLCPLREQNPGFYQGYAQRLAGYLSYFEVDPSPWLNDAEYSPRYCSAFAKSLPPLRDYSLMKIKGAEDEMNISSFFHTSKWFHHLKGYTSKDVEEVLRASTPEARFGERLREVAQSYLSQANDELLKHNSFGILRTMGQTTEYVNSSFVFTSLIFFF